MRATWITDLEKAFGSIFMELDLGIWCVMMEFGPTWRGYVYLKNFTC